MRNSYVALLGLLALTAARNAYQLLKQQGGEVAFFHSLKRCSHSSRT